jgi:hypothetical protein
MQAIHDRIVSRQHLQEALDLVEALEEGDREPRGFLTR